MIKLPDVISIMRERKGNEEDFILLEIESRSWYKCNTRGLYDIQNRRSLVSHRQEGQHEGKALLEQEHEVASRDPLEPLPNFIKSQREKDVHFAKDLT